jgi:hypothetical protein
MISGINLWHLGADLSILKPHCIQSSRVLVLVGTSTLRCKKRFRGSCPLKKTFFLLHGNFLKKKLNGPLTPSPNEKFRFFWPRIRFATVPKIMILLCRSCDCPICFEPAEWHFYWYQSQPDIRCDNIEIKNL